MARKKATDPPPRKRIWLFQAALMALVAAGFVAGLIFLGQWGLEQIRGRDRYLVPFAEIECVPPPGLSKGEFLDEVQYLSRLPERLGVLDDDLPAKLTAAFAKHPWVEKVEGVVLTPPRHVQVQIVPRRPVLAVRTVESLVAVDSQGVRLPKNAVTTGLPVYDGDAPPPQGPAGTRWGDAKVEEQARRLRKR